MGVPNVSSLFPLGPPPRQAGPSPLWGCTVAHCGAQGDDGLPHAPSPQAADGHPPRAGRGGLQWPRRPKPRRPHATWPYTLASLRMHTASAVFRESPGGGRGPGVATRGGPCLAVPGPCRPGCSARRRVESKQFISGQRHYRPCLARLGSASLCVARHGSARLLFLRTHWSAYLRLPRTSSAAARGTSGEGPAILLERAGAGEPRWLERPGVSGAAWTARGSRRGARRGQARRGVRKLVPTALPSSAPGLRCAA